MKRIITASAGLAAILAFAACSAESLSVSTFDPSDVSVSAVAYKAKFSISNGCLKVQVKDQPSPVVVLAPAKTELTHDTVKMEKESFKVGEDVSIGGGRFPLKEAQAKYRGVVNKACENQGDSVWLLF